MTIMAKLSDSVVVAMPSVAESMGQGEGQLHCDVVCVTNVMC